MEKYLWKIVRWQTAGKVFGVSVGLVFTGAIIATSYLKPGVYYPTMKGFYFGLMLMAQFGLCMPWFLSSVATRIKIVRWIMALGKNAQRILADIGKGIKNLNVNKITEDTKIAGLFKNIARSKKMPNIKALNNKRAKNSAQVTKLKERLAVAKQKGKDINSAIKKSTGKKK